MENIKQGNEICQPEISKNNNTTLSNYILINNR